MICRRLLCLLLLLACACTHASAEVPRLQLAYASDAALAAAVRQRLAASSMPAPALAALAGRVAGGQPDRQAQALALANWVRIHIRLLGARLRLQGPPPLPAAEVLARGAGNREERAALMQALLAARGIASSAALASSGARAELPAAAMPAAYDHLLVYLPALDLFLDPAATKLAAGFLPPALLGKPVLLASGGYAMTPLAQRQSVATLATVEVRRDGSGTVTLERTYAGALAEPVRRAVHDAPPALRAQVVRRMLPGLAHGPGTPAPAAADSGADGFRLSLLGAGAQVLGKSGAPALPTSHPWLGTVADALAALPWDSAGGQSVACPAVDASDEARYRLPRQMKILALPAPLSVTSGGIFYRAAYERHGNTVLVKRRLSFRNGRPGCTPAEVRALRPALEKIARDLRSRVRLAMP